MHMVVKPHVQLLTGNVMILNLACSDSGADWVPLLAVLGVIDLKGHF